MQPSRSSLPKGVSFEDGRSPLRPQSSFPSISPRSPRSQPTEQVTSQPRRRSIQDPGALLGRGWPRGFAGDHKSPLEHRDGATNRGVQFLREPPSNPAGPVGSCRSDTAPGLRSGIPDRSELDSRQSLRDFWSSSVFALARLAREVRVSG